MIMGRLPFMSSFRQPISLLNCLRRGQRKRQNRQKSQSFACSYTTAEQLEDRTLLAGASLLNIEPNIDLSLTDGEVYNEAPTELKFTFDQEIDANSLNGIQIVRAGHDNDFTESIQIQPGFIGIGEKPNEVILRFAESLPDDNYQITIFGDGATPLLNQIGEAFQDGTNAHINFELELGAKVVAVVSQPVLREQVLTVDDISTLQDGDTFTISVGGAEVTFEMDLDGNGLNDTANTQVIFNASQSASDIAGNILAAFNSSVLATDGYAIIAQNLNALTISGDSFNPAIAFSLADLNTPALSQSQGDLIAKNDQILVYFNNDDLNVDLAEDEKFYQIIDVTNANAIIDTADYTATYDALSDVTVLKFTTPLTAGNQYRLRVGVSDTPNDATNSYTTADSETITVLAGTGGTTTPVDGVTLISDLDLNDPSNLVIDGAGNYYFVHTDSSDGTIRILRVDHQSNEITIIAGSDGTIDPADEILATDLQLTNPRDLALDKDDNLFLTDGVYVLKIDSVTQRVTVIAGGGTDDTPELGDLATDLELNTPAQLTVDSVGNLFFHDSGLDLLIFIDQASGLVAGTSSTLISGSSIQIIDLEIDLADDLYAVLFTPIFLPAQIVRINTQTGALLTVAGGGGDTDPATGDLTLDLDLSGVTDIDFDANGFLYYTDSNGFVVKFDPTADEADRTIEVLSGNGGGGTPATGDPAETANLNSPSSLAIGTGNIPYFFDNGHNLLFRVENLPDQNSAFHNATVLNGGAPDVSSPWNAGAEEFVITSEIQPQAIGLPPLPGGNDEPGHRTLPAGLDDHGAGSGTNPVTAGAVSVIYYNFRDVYGTDVQGNPLHNAITEEQKQRTREIFEIYAYYTGVEFIESANRGISVITGDLRAADPALPVGPGGVAGVSTGGTVIMDSSDFIGPGADVFGGGWMNVAFHEIGHSLGLGHSLDIPSLMGNLDLPQDSGQTVYPGDYDLVHLLRLFRNDANDIDLYQFDLDESGTFRAEVFAERLQNVSLLNSALTLYDENKNVIARNDDYFSNDSFLELSLSAGTYYIGISSTGNNIYNPEIENSGEHGTTDGQYELRLNFAADPIVDTATPTNSEILLDESGTQFDGDSDGTPGGAYDFWFVASDASNTIYVDKTNGSGGDGTLGNAYSKISEALDNIDPTTDVVRILGNGGVDGDLRTTNDSDSYLVGYDDNFNPLEDGETITVPQGVTVVIDQGAVIKLQNTVIDVGSSSVLVDRSNAALQIIGTPDAQVVLTAFGNDAVGGDDDGPSDGANAGDWGGIVFRSDSDYEEDSVFLNYIANADISYGGGQVFVDSVLQSFAPIHIDEARPTLANNTITFSANAAISADPNSFNESIIDAAGNYNRDQTLNRIGPDIYGNTIVNNSLNGLFIRSETLFGQEIDQVEVTARFDDTDIVHIITENLFIEAGTGGPIDMGAGLESRYSGSVRFDPGMIVKLGGSRIQTGRGNAGIIAEGTEESPIIFTSIFDDRYGAGGTFDTTNNDVEGASERQAEIGDWGGLILNQTSHASIDHAVIAYAGGVTPIEGLSDSFNPIEVHQADLRVTNTLFENNQTIASRTDRNSLGRNESTVIFVRGAQPIIVGNTFINNRVHEGRDDPNVNTPPPVLTDGSVININANSLSSVLHNDYGRSTGRLDAFDHLNGNHGALVRLNQFEANDLNGMVIRGELLTVESIWDDTDIDHVVFDTITVDNFHTYGGLRLQSSSDASLVVKFGANAGFTATGHGLDINDRIGGIVQIIGNPQNPVVLTSVHDDSIGSGIGLDGFNVKDTLTQFSIDAAAGDWTGLQFLEFSHDRNVALINEGELTVLDSQGDVNGIIRNAQFLGELAPEEKSGDENRRLGFEVHGSVAANDSGDADIYSFNAQAGTEVWIDIDRTGLALDTVIELLDPLGRVLAIATNNTDASNPGASPFATDPGGLIANTNFGGDFYSSNPNDAGMRVVLPGLDGILTTYFVRVRSNSSDLTDVNGGESHGDYQLQIRLRQVDEEPGSTVRHADIRYATTAIDLQGLPAHSPLINETVESGDNGDAGDSRTSAQNLGNLLASDRNTIGVSGELTSDDIDFYRFDLTIQDIQSIAGVNAGGKTWATVFDIDYADGLGRADTTLSVFDSEGRLIFVSRESNVEDDQDSAGQDDNDITRGSFGTLDPYIGSVHIPEAATYYVAVTANTLLASALQATYDGSDSNALVRLEPINSLQRIVEDHIGSQGYSSNGIDIEPDGALFDITDGGIDTHVTNFDLSDVVLFTTNGHNLATVDPQLGEYETNIGDIAGISTTNSNLQITDLVMRSDGRLFGIQNNRLIEINTAGEFNNSGDPVTTLDDVVGTTNIPEISGNQVIPAGFTNTSLANLRTHLNLFNNLDTGPNTVSIDAITYARVNFQNGAPVYELYYVVRETGLDSNGIPRTFQKLYEANPTTGAVIGNFEQFDNGIVQNGFRGYLLEGNLTTASASELRADNNTTPRSGTLYVQSIVPGTDGEGISVEIVGHADADEIEVTAAGTITIRLDNRNNGSAAWNLGEIVAQINNDDEAKLLVKAGMLGNASTNGFQAFAGETLVTSGAIGTADFNALGRVQGLAFNEFNVNGATQLIGVTNNGNVIDIDVSQTDGAIAQGLATHGGMNFTGAALGPQNLYDGAYSNYVFATTNDGTLVALDSTGVLQGVFGPGVTAADSGTTSADIDTSSVPNFDAEDDAEDVTGNIQGLAFSPLDFNLWHTTRTRGTDAGHGINAAPDNSRVPSEIDLELDKLANEDHNFNQSNGALSFYFGLEQFTTGDNTYLSYEEIGAQLGIRNSDFLRDLTHNADIGNNVNLPGGALGSLETNEFSLAGYESKDAPTLYFNYFLETESTNSTTNNAMRDSARVFLSTDGGTTWNLVATNNSTKSTSDNPWELPTYNTHTAAENTNPDDTGRDYVQELFDNTDAWRQARIDLSDFAGEANIRLRFDYSTAGTLGTLNDFESDIRGGVTDAFNKSRRGQNNLGEGFYIDDIIVGFAERGEMVTNSNTGVDTFFNVYGPGNAEPGDAAGEILTGSYNLEIRRASEYAFLLDPMEPFIGIAQPFDTNTRLVEENGLLGDDNFRREQGLILIEGNQILSSTDGISIKTVRGDGNFPHQGGTRVLPILNSGQLAPGAVLVNNLIVNSESSGIEILGDTASPESVSPLVKIINNTIHGGGTNTGGVDTSTGISISGRVSPTIVNNIISETGTAISSLGTGPTVIDANLFYHNVSTGSVGTNDITFSTQEVAALFVNAAEGNFYLADNSAAIDSSLNRLADRPLYAAVKGSLGIPASDIFAPNFDAFGQLRVDDPTQSPPPGLGPNIFKDKGAIERADFVGPTAVITLPPDNDVNGVDLDPDATEVYISNPALFSTMIVELRDAGIGIDDNVMASQFELTAQTSSSFRTLVEGIDYIFSYNSNTNEAIFTSTNGVFSLDTLYTIDIDNSDATGVKDLAGNSLLHNQQDLSTSFTIRVTDGVNDPPINNYDSNPILDSTPVPGDPTIVVTTEAETPFVFTGVDAISITDPDAFLAGDGEDFFEVTLTAVNGTLTLGSTANVTMQAGTTGLGGESTITFRGLLADVNAALDGTTFQPTSGYYTSIDPLNPATITIVTNDLGNFDGTPETDTDTIEIFVNDPPIVQFESATYTVSESDDGTVTTLDVTLTRNKIGAISTVLISDLLTGSASPGVDYTTIAVDTPVSFAADEFTTTFSITILDDDIVELNETIHLEITGVAFNALLDDPTPLAPPTQKTATVTIDDTLDTAQITFVSDDLSVNEEAGTVTFTVQMSNVVAEEVSFDLTTQDGASLVDRNATDELTDSDYEAKTQTITFAALTPVSNTQDFVVTITNDDKLELDEIFNVLMSNLSANGLESRITLDDPAQATIVDDSDTAQITFVDDDLSVNEEDGTLTFTVQISNAIAEDVSFDLTTQDGSSGVDRNATDELTDDDYTAKTQTFTFVGTQDTDVVPGTQNFEVTITNDDKLELDEIFNVIMDNLSANGLDSRISLATPAQATIVDDSDTATITFVDDDLSVNEEDGRVTFTVQISNAIAEDVSFDLTTQDGSSGVDRNATDESTDDDYTAKTQTFTFVGTQDTDVVPGTQNFEVTITNDDKLELDEIFNVIMENLSANGLDSRISLATPAQATIIDDSDTATITFVDDDLSVNEEDGTVTFTVQISNAIAEDVSFDLTTQDGSSGVDRNATDELTDDDYTARTQNFTFVGTQDTDVIPGTQNFEVTITNDDKLELDEIFNVIMENLNAGGLNDRLARITLDTPAQATILDDSDTATITFVDDDLSVNEEDGTVTFTVQISNAIAEDVSFALTTQDGTATDESIDDDYNFKTQSFTFVGTQDTDVVPGTQNFEVTIINDDKLELDEIFNVFMDSLSTSGLNDRTERITLDTPAQATILDDSDTATITFIEDDITINEEGAIVFFSIRISNAIAENISVDLTTQDGTSSVMRNATDENTDNDYTAKTETFTFLGTPNTDNIPGIQTFFVELTNDDKLELDEIFNVIMENLNAGGLNDRVERITLDNPAQVTIVDDTDTAFITFVNNSLSVNEEAGSVTFEVQISNAIAEDVSFDLTTRDGFSPIPAGGGIATDELLDDDYRSNSESFTFVGTPDTDDIPGFHNFTVTIIDDDKVELDELFSVFIDNLNANGLDSRITLGTDASGVIRNTDSALISIESVSPAGIDEGSANSTTDLIFNVSISNAVDIDVTFDVSTQDGTATAADNDYIPILNQPFTFSGSANSDTLPGQQSFTVQIPHDKKVELDEIFDVIISNLNSAGRNVSTGSISQGTILNDDSAVITIDSISKLESDGEFIFSATISNPIDTIITVDVHTEGVSPLLDDTDYNAILPLAPTTLSFGPTDPLIQRFTVIVNDDNIVEGDEFFSTILTNLISGGREVSIVNGTNQGHIRNDDSATFTITPVIDTENNSPFEFLVELSNPVDVPITVEASTIDGTATSINIPIDFQSINGQVLTFNPGITQLPIFVSVFEDGVIEGPETFEVILENLNPNGRAVFLTSIAARSSSATSDAAVAVDVVGDFAYVADRDGGLQIFNVADSENPFNVGSFDFNNQGIAQGIDVVGNLAYLAVGEAGLQILDVSDPSNPTFVGSITTPARARGVQVIGNLAYVADDSGNGGGLQIIDISNPAAPTNLGSFGVATPGGLAGGVIVIGNIAYVTDGNNGLQIVDVTDSSNPTQIHNVPTPGGAAIGLDIVGNFAYVANREGGLQVIDISTPATASIVGTLDTPGVATGVRVVGNFAYVADSAAGLQVIDISNPTNPTLANTFDTPGSARSLHVSGTLAFVADTFSGLQILEFFPSTIATGTIVDPGGAPLTGTASVKTTISTSLVYTPSSTDVNGETSAVPESEEWIDEWDSFWVEVWGTTTDGAGITGGTFDLHYNTNFFTATAVEFGSAFGNSSSASIDDLNGVISGISGQNGHGTLGSTNQVLLGRVKFESLADDDVSIDDISGFLGPHNLGIQVVNGQLDIANFGGVTASVAQSPTTELWAVPFDLDDNGIINFRDLMTFATFYGTTIADSTSGVAWSLDFDKSGTVDFRDLNHFAANYGITKESGRNIVFPSNFPKEWYGTSITTEGDDSFNELIDSAVDEWKTATGNEDLAVQVVVTDLGGQQLGEGQILELDENGIPVKGRVYIDDDAAGLGWYSSIEGHAFDSNGQAITGSAAEGHYDLYTVLLHEIGHVAGFNTSYSAYADHVETSNSGQVQFVSWDFTAPLTSDGQHLDHNFYPNDLLAYDLDPSTRKLISTLDVQIIQAAYANSAGAVIAPNGLPLMAAITPPVNKTTETKQHANKPVSPTTTAQSQQSAIPSVTQEPVAKSEQLPAWYSAPTLMSRESVMSLGDSTELDQLAGSLIDVSYEMEQYLSDEFETIKTEEETFQIELADEFELDEFAETEVVNEELDSLFTAWSGPLI